jgi:acylphosphatase
LTCRHPDRYIERTVTGTGPACRRWLVSGRVQGVGFRYYVVRNASRLGLVGTVRNLSEGQVEVVARGEADVLEQLDELLRRGPSTARVTGVSVGIGVLAVDCDRFEVGG